MRTTQDNKSVRLRIPVLAGLMACTSLSTDIYLPAIPTIERELEGQAELTITGFLIGFALAQLIWGPVSDRIGRKKPLIIGMLLFAGGSVGCALSGSIHSLVFWRIVQACGACVGPLLSRSMVSDVNTREDSARIFALLMMLLAVSPILAPLLGAVVAEYWSWRIIFWILATISFVLFLSVLKQDETLPEMKRSDETIVSRLISFKSILGNRSFLKYLLCVFFFTSAVYAFLTASSYVYINHFHLNPKIYSLLFGVNMVGVVITSNITRKLSGRIPLDSLLKISTMIALIGGAMLLCCSAFGIGGPVMIAVPVFIICAMNGFISSCCNASALSFIPPSQVGAATSLLGAFQYGSGILSSAILAFFTTDSPVPMSSLMITFIVLSALSLRINGRKY